MLASSDSANLLAKVVRRMFDRWPRAVAMRPSSGYPSVTVTDIGRRHRQVLITLTNWHTRPMKNEVLRRTRRRTTV